MMRVTLAVLLLALSAGAGAATVYKWRDAEGRLHITSEKPPAGAKIESRLTVPNAPTAAAPARPSWVEESAPSRAPATPAVEIVMYATKRCPYCRKARQYFAGRGLSWREVDIEASSAADREFKARGGQGVPLIFINGTRVAGWSAEEVGALLDRGLAQR
jgi:glutaredoxin